MRSAATQTQERELVGKDDQWARMVDLVLVPLPRLQGDKPAVTHSAMCDNALIIETRTALPGYIFGRKAVRTYDPGLDSAYYYPWLKGALMHHGVRAPRLWHKPNVTPLYDC